jgi:hypothetical protein
LATPPAVRPPTRFGYPVLSGGGAVEMRSLSTVELGRPGDGG